MYEKIRASMHHNDLSNEALRGLLCDACDLGPCKFNEEYPDDIAPCGITPDKMAVKNLAEKVIEGMSEYRLTVPQLSKLYKIEKIMKIAAESLPISLSYTRKIDRLLSPYRTPRFVTFGLGGLEPDMVNICAAAPPDKIFELMLELRKKEYETMADNAGAKGINVVSLGAPGAEMAYQMGTPCIGNFLITDDAKETGILDSIYAPWSNFSIIEKAVKAYEARKDEHHTPSQKSYYLSGTTPDATALDEAYKRGDIAGAIFMFGAASYTCEWDMDALVRSLVDKGYVVFISGAHLYEGTDLPRDGPSVQHIGFCEPGKIMDLRISMPKTVLVPGWKNPKLLTSTLGMAHAGYRIILGNNMPVTSSVKDELESKGIAIECDWKKLSNSL